MDVWSEDDFAIDPASLAKRLLGQRLVRLLPDGSRLAGLIVETEAYLGERDLAAHSVGARRTARTEPMFGSPGTIYVFLTYGMHHCVNVVCGAVDEPVAVLIRALEPVEGMEQMRSLRGGSRSLRATDLCSGPAKLCQALAIDRSLDGWRFQNGPKRGVGELRIERTRGRALPQDRLLNTPRIGVEFAGEWATAPLRWAIRENPHVSRGRPSGERNGARSGSRVQNSKRVARSTGR